MSNDVIYPPLDDATVRRLEHFKATGANISADTMRRLKYAVFEQELPDGTHRFVHDPGVIRGDDALISSSAADRGKGERSSDALVKEQSAARESSEPSVPSRDSHGRFATKGKS